MELKRAQRAASCESYQGTRMLPPGQEDLFTGDRRRASTMSSRVGQWDKELLIVSCCKSRKVLPAVDGHLCHSSFAHTLTHLCRELVSRT